VIAMDEEEIAKEKKKQYPSLRKLARKMDASHERREKRK